MISLYSHVNQKDESNRKCEGRENNVGQLGEKVARKDTEGELKEDSDREGR